MYSLRRATATKEEKVATRLATLLSDFTLDIEAVGKFLATSVPHILYTRVVEVLESAKYQNETGNEYDSRWGYKK
jgi:2'-5' RNA ligase